MNSEKPQPSSTASWINRPSTFRVLIWCFGVVLFVFALVPVLHSLRGHSIKDYIVWYETGQQVLHGGEIYPDQWHKSPFLYPTPFALFLAPISALGHMSLVVLLVFVTAAAWISSILLYVQLDTAPRGLAQALSQLVHHFVVGLSLG